MPTTAIQMLTIFATTAGASPPDPNAPLRHRFCGPTFNSHIEFLGHRLRLLNGTLFQVGFFEGRFSQAQKIFLRRHRSWGRFRKTLAGDGKRFLEVVPIEPL
jgi:hypothetical protein